MAEALLANKILTTIDLKFNSIGDDGAKELAKALKFTTSLQDFQLFGNPIGDDGAKVTGGIGTPGPNTRNLVNCGF